MSNSPLLSLCIVALNESAFIGPCIESAKSIADEIIVVDTGSKDGTPEIARSHGARVIRVDYPGDQASAFNIFLQHAQGDWILNLDADEVLDPEKKGQIRRVIENRSFDGYFFIIRNYIFFPQTKWTMEDPGGPVTRGGRGFIPSRTIRLFRAHPDNRYEGLLHQRIHQSILQRGGKIGNCPVPIHHYGHLRHARLNWKLPRFLEVQQNQVKQNPKDARSHVELGVVSIITGDLFEAEQSFRRATELGYGTGALFFLGKLLFSKGEPEKAAELLERALREYSEDRDIDFEPADGWESLGRAWIELKDFEKGEWAYKKALACRPKNPVVRNDLASLWNIQGACDKAANLIGEFVAQHPGFDIPWVTLGISKMCSRDFEDAKAAFLRALSINPLNSQAKFHLAQTLEELGEREESEKVWMILRDEMVPDEVAKFGASPFFPEEKKPIKKEPKKRRQCKPIVNLIPCLSGNMGQVLICLVHLLKDRSHLVLCGDSGTYSDLELKEELQEMGVEICVTPLREKMIRRLKQVNPEYVFVHLPHPFFQKELPPIQARWIAVGHDFLPLPPGYDAYIVHSSLQANLQSHLPGEKIYRIPLGGHPGCFEKELLERKSDGETTVIMISDLDPGLFPRHLLRYLPPLENKRVRIVIVGRGARRYEIEPELEDSGFKEIIRFAGPVSWKKIPELLLDSDIGLHLPEVHEEAFPVSVMNMLAAGLPVITKSWGSLPGLVFSKKNGFLVEDEKEAAEKLDELIWSKKLRTIMGEQSRKTSKIFSSRPLENSLKKIFDDLGTPPGRL